MRPLLVSRPLHYLVVGDTVWREWRGRKEQRERERERERVDESKVITTEQGTVVDLDMVTKEKVMAKRKTNKGEDGAVLLLHCRLYT